MKKQPETDDERMRIIDALVNKEKRRRPTAAERQKNLETEREQRRFEEPVPLYKNHYRCILADPPWSFRSYAAPKDPKASRHVENHYQTMTLSDINALPIRDLCHPDGAHLFLWATGPNLENAFSTIKAWGFKYSGIGFTWAKLARRHGPRAQLVMIPLADIASEMHTGLGFTTRKNTEICLLARRGNARRIGKSVRELIIAPVREHSRKPDEAVERIEQYCDGPYLELFARSGRPGWTSWGDQVGKFQGAS